MPDTAIVIKHLHYSYGSKSAVQDISLDVAGGEIFGFLGPNGAGKTTTVKILTGLLPPQQGDVRVLGKEMPRQARVIQCRIGVSFEKTNLYEMMSADENLKLFARLFGIKRFDPAVLLRRVELEGKGRDRVDSYSKGMKQRLMIARALVNAPDILFLDEPTDGLDPVSAETIRRIIQEERERGAAVFLTTHDMHEADKLSDRVAFINQGKIVAVDTPYRLKQAYGERALKVETLRPDGTLEQKKLVLDRPATSGELKRIMEEEQVLTLHSGEASLEDIFIEITGRGLA